MNTGLAITASVTGIEGDGRHRREMQSGNRQK